MGTGLTPQPRLPFRRLGITEDEANEIKEQMVWIWAEWCAQADAGGTMHFEDLQLAGIHSLLRPGELLHLPVMEDPSPENGRSIAHCLQELSPKRLCTPSDKQTDPYVRDGVHVNEYGSDFFEEMDTIEVEEKRLAKMPTATAPVSVSKRTDGAGKPTEQGGNEPDEDEQSEDADANG